MTIKINPTVTEYSKAEAEETGILYQALINLYLLDCVKKKLEMNWM